MKTASYLKSVRSALPEAERPLLDQAFAGDALAARRLMIVAPLRLRGHIACLAYQLKVSNPAYREMLVAIWARESRHLLIDFWPKPMLRRMFARGDFPIPPLAGPVTIFRHACGVSVRKAAGGLCWTASLQEAMRKAGYAAVSDPRIIQSSVDPKDIIFWGNSHGEQEVIVRHPAKEVTLYAAAPTPFEPMRLVHGGR
jgi:hypothetical protein